MVNPCQAHGRVWPGTKESRSSSRSSFSGGPTKYNQTLHTAPPDRPTAKVLQLHSYTLHLVLLQCPEPKGENNVIFQVGGGGLLKAVRRDPFSQDKCSLTLPPH